MCSRVRLAEVNTAGVTPTSTPTPTPNYAAEQEVCYLAERIHMQSGAALAGFSCTYENNRQMWSLCARTRTLTHT